MSEEKVKIKLSMEDSKNFYESVYKKHANSETSLSSHTSEYLNELNSNVLAKRQNEYKPLINDFLAISKERKISLDDTLKYVDLSMETWNIWMDSKNKGSKINPVTFNNTTIYKMAALVLKDLAVKHVEDNKLTSFDSKELAVIVQKAQDKISGGNKPMFNDFDDGPTQNNAESKNSKTYKIKP